MALRRWARKIRTSLVTGVFVLTPLAVTAYIVASGFLFVDRFFGSLVQRVAGRPLPGVGFLLTLVVIAAVGVIGTNIVGKRVIALGEWVFTRIPIVRVIYSSVKQIVEAFNLQNQTPFQEVVLVEHPRRGLWAIGFVTNRKGGVLQEALGRETVTVFVPTTPNPTSGFLVVAPAEEIVKADLSVDEAFKFIISGGLVAPPSASQ